MPWTAVMIGIIGVAAVLIVLGISLDKEHIPIKLFFFILALFLCLIALSGAAEIVAVDQSLAGGSAQEVVDIINSAYKGMTYLIYFIIPYFIIYFIWKVSKAFIPYTKKRSR